MTPKGNAALSWDPGALNASIEDIRLDAARNSFPHFCEYAMIDDTGTPWKFAKHQYELDALLNLGHKRQLVIWARCAGKTTFMAARVLWELGRNPNLCFKYVCGSDAVGLDRLRFFGNNIQHNERYRKVFPHVTAGDIGEWTRHKIFIPRPAAAGIQDASIECCSVMSSKTGSRCHRVIFDDILDSGDALFRPANMAKIKEMVETDWLSTLYPGGLAWMIGTFWSFDPPDIHVEYSTRPDWHPMVRPACNIDAHDELCGPYLWPEKWGKEQLEQRRIDGPEGFAQQYLLQGAIQRSQFFAEDHIDACIDESVALGDTPFDIVRVGMGVDPGGFSPDAGRARTVKAQRSHCSIFVVGVGANGRKIPLSILRLQDDAEVAARAIVELWERWQPSEIICENNAMQQALVSLIRVIADQSGLTLPLKGKFTGRQKWNPDAGLPGLNAEMAQGKWVIPLKGDHEGERHECPVCVWLDEMRYWGKPIMPNGKKPTSDIIMSWWLANTAVDTHGVFSGASFPALRTRKGVRFGPQSRVAGAPG